MKRPGPLLTLLAGLLLGLSLLTLDTTTGTKAPTTPYRERSPSPAPTPGTVSPASPAPAPAATPSRAPDGDYAGRTDDDTAAVAVSVRAGRAIAYFCDGRTRESWLRGEVRADGAVRLTGRHGAELTGRLEDGARIEGTVGVGGEPRAFTAVRARKPSGLWRATAAVRSAKVDGGWIVLRDGSQVGVLTRDGVPSPAPRLDPRTGAVTVDGRRLTARPALP
ncbi:hypothetical protein [Streptomyces sp. NPDC021608]|uniref:hypothetical protein n=1 Tax=Streptomyces sp. NPDC021608 TaxID=3154903 RepID=UPI00340AD7DA